MRREIKTKLGPCNTIRTAWCLYGDEAVMVFEVRTGGGRDDLCWGIDAHRYTERPDGWETHIEECAYTGGECWCDGSPLQASQLWDRLRETPDEELIWTTLADRYARWVEQQDDESLAAALVKEEQ
jgi:hypothetical protein